MAQLSEDREELRGIFGPVPAGEDQTASRAEHRAALMAARVAAKGQTAHAYFADCQSVLDNGAAGPGAFSPAKRHASLWRQWPRDGGCDLFKVRAQ